MMASRERTKQGDIPATVGWQKLLRHLEKESAADLAAQLGVRQPSVFSWIWRDKRPSQERLPAICRITKAKIADWWAPISSAEADLAIRKMKGRAA
jgi:transcriptional regulator with XRE-family HTH domain